VKLRPRRTWSSYAKVQAWIGHAIRNRRFQLGRGRVRESRYLDLGCGRNTHAAFVNMDFFWHPAVDLCWDLRRGLPFAGGRLLGIFSEHCLEHFSLPAVEALLRECRRVLAPGGTVRLAVPDAELYLRTYARAADGESEARFPFQDQEGLAGDYVPLLSVNRVFYQDRDSPAGHRVMFDFALLALLLRRAGFERIVKEEFRSGRDPVLLIDAPERRVESLYVEASAPSESKA